MGTNNSPVASGYLYLFCGHKPLWLVLLSEDPKLGQRKHTLSFCQKKTWSIMTNLFGLSLDILSLRLEQEEVAHLCPKQFLHGAPQPS